MKIGPKYKICRRLGEAVFSKCQTPKFAVAESKKSTKGAKKTRGGRGGKSEYGSQLLEKQKVRYTYGISERQLSNYVMSSRKKRGIASDSLYTELERRLDNVIYRLGFVNSRAFARQVVSHGHIHVNGKRVSIPSYQVKKGDKVSIRPKSSANSIFLNMDEKTKDHAVSSWLKLSEKKFEAEVLALPASLEDGSILNFGAIIQFYSRV